MKSKSIKFKELIEQIEDVLVKVHSKNIHGDPITQVDDEWNNARARLQKIKTGNAIDFVFPISWALADILIIDELAHREGAPEEHIQLNKERN
jgi:hypothetical protein